MPQSLKVLRRRVRSIRNTKQITRAMEMVAASKLRRSQAALMAARPYIRKLQLLLGRLAPAAQAAGHPLFEQRTETRRRTILVVTGDRGLCGSFNTQLLRQAEIHIRTLPRQTVELFCIGRRGATYFERLGWPVIEKYENLGGVLDTTVSDHIAEFLCHRFLSGETDEVRILYSTFISASHSRPTWERYLSIDSNALLQNTPSEERLPPDYLFDPGRDEVIKAIVPAYLRARIYIILAESFTSEHSARMLAMNNASKNCDELMENLTLKLNKARQSSITGDLLDIVGGAEALNAEG